MAGLSLQEIADFNNPAAFTRSRTVAASATTSPSSIDTSTNKATLKTQSLNESFSLVSGISNRLELIQGNLLTMLQLANEGLSVTNQTDRDEIFGKLRSLSGGIDDIVDATLFSGQATLDGRTLNLSYTSNGTVDKRLELGNYYGANEGGLDLSRQPSYAVTDTYYDFYSSSRNANSGIVGLDITEAYASQVQSTEVELDTGTYQIEISYEGPNSTVSILNSNGVLLNTVEDVDLSGSGQELVDLGVGATISVEKVQLLDSVDKYPYDTVGPAKFYAKLDYRRVFRQDLAQEGFSQVTQGSVSTTYNKRLTDSSGGAFEIESVELGGVKPGQVGLASGSYSVRVNYNGANSSIEVKDSLGNLKYLDHKIDLSGNDKVSVNTGLGLTFTIDNDNYANSTGEVVALVDYRASEVSNEEFDFRQYVTRIEDALELVATDIEVMANVQNDILNLNSLLNGSGLQSSGSGAFVGQLIGGALDGTTSAAFASNQVTQAGAEIFQATGNATAVQAEVLATRAASAQLA